MDPAAARRLRARLHTAALDAMTGLRTTGGQAGALNGVLGWWAVTSSGLLGVLLAVLALMWPSTVRTFAAEAVGAWLLFVALGRFGGGQLLLARYGGSRTSQSGAGLLAVAAVVVTQVPADGPAAAVTSLAFGVAAAVDAGSATPFPGLARACLRTRAACGLVAALAVAAAPVTGLVVAAACVGLGEVVLAARLLPEMERLHGMRDPAAPGTTSGVLLPLFDSAADRP